jgi:hypothetical protein
LSAKLATALIWILDGTNFLRVNTIQFLPLVLLQPVIRLVLFLLLPVMFQLLPVLFQLVFLISQQGLMFRQLLRMFLQPQVLHRLQQNQWQKLNSVYSEKISTIKYPN